MLAFGALLLLGGRLADVLGPRRVFEADLVVFVASSLASGLATTPVLLIAARALQGTGAVLLTPAALSLVLAISPRRRPRRRVLRSTPRTVSAEQQRLTADGPGGQRLLAQIFSRTTADAATISPMNTGWMSFDRLWAPSGRSSQMASGVA